MCKLISGKSFLYSWSNSDTKEIIIVPKLVESIVIMRSNKGRIDFSDYKEEKEECSSSDEEDVESEPEGESAVVEQVEMEGNENDCEGENVSLVEDDSEP